jgi:hypothetical protein
VSEPCPFCDRDPCEGLDECRSFAAFSYFYKMGRHRREADALLRGVLHRGRRMRREGVGKPMPFGAIPIAAFICGNEIIICGDPPNEQDDPGGELHNCDANGCGQDHVLYRLPLSVLPSPGASA